MGDDDILIPCTLNLPRSLIERLDEEAAKRAAPHTRVARGRSAIGREFLLIGLQTATAERPTENR